MTWAESAAFDSNRSGTKAFDELDEPSEPVVDGVLQDLLVEIGVLMRQHVSHTDNSGPLLRCFSVEEAPAHPVDGVDGNFKAMAHRVTYQGVVQRPAGQVLLEDAQVLACGVEGVGRRCAGPLSQFDRIFEGGRGNVRLEHPSGDDVDGVSQEPLQLDVEAGEIEQVGARGEVDQ